MGDDENSAAGGGPTNDAASHSNAPRTPSAGPALPPRDAAPEAVSRRAALLRRLAAARRLWRAEYVFVVALAVFAVLATYAKANAYFAWDLRAARAVQSLALPGTASLMRAVSVFGDGPNSWALTGAAMLIFFLRRRRTEAFSLLFATGGGALINGFVKHFIARPRPTLEQVRVSGRWARESFPSGHVTFYVCFFGFLFFAAFALLPKGSLKRRAALALAALPVLTVGLSRVYLGAHWPSDTLGAYLLSGVWLALTLHLYRKWKAGSTLHPNDAAAAGLTKATDSGTSFKA